MGERRHRPSHDGGTPGRLLLRYNWLTSMPAPTFTQDDLSLPPNQLAQLTTGLANLGVADPVGGAVAESTDKIALYSRGYVIPDSQWRRLMRPLAIWSLFNLIGQVSEAQQKAYEDAMKELEAIRDGDFDLPLAETDPEIPESRGGAWGSETKIATR